MKQNLLTSLALCAFILVSGMSQVIAEEKTQASALSSAAIEQVYLINKLIDLGDARKDPILLLAAAKLQKSISQDAVAASPESYALKDVLARVKKLAKGRQDIAGLADDVTASKTKGYYTSSYSGGSKYCYIVGGVSVCN